MPKKDFKFNMPPRPILLRQMALRAILIAIGIGIGLSVVSLFSLGLVIPIAGLAGQIVMVFSFQTTDPITQERFQLVTRWNYVIAGAACIMAPLATGIFHYLGCNALQSLHMYGIGIFALTNCSIPDIFDVAKRSTLASGLGLALYVGFFSFLLRHQHSST